MLYAVLSPLGRRSDLITFLCRILAALTPLSSFASGSVTLAWDSSADPSVAGYNSYYGAASRTYTNMVNVGTNTTLTISNLIEGVTYYFAATTYNASDLESDYSVEIAYHVPVNLPNQPPTLNPPTNPHLVVQGRGTLSPNLNAQSLVVGKAYTVTALPAAGQEFAGWTGSLTSSQAKVTFGMSSNLLLQANFIPSPFIPVQGVYHGLFFETDQVRQYSAGAFTVSTTKHGTYSGHLQIGAFRHSFSGRLNLQCQATNIISKGTNAFRLALNLGSGVLPDQIAGQVSGGTWTAVLSGDRAVFNSRTNPAPMAGAYTALLPGQDSDPLLPEGDGYGAVRVSASGVAALVGTLADGSKVSSAVSLSKQGQWPLYVSLYSGSGSFLSWLAFTHRPDDDFNGALSWIKPANAHTRYYPAGFTNECVALGSAYRVPLGATNLVLGFTNGDVAFMGGNLASAFTNSVALERSSRVFDYGTNKLSMSFSLSRGTFRGSVADPISRKSLSFSGAVFQRANSGYGLLLGTNRSSRVVMEP